MGAIIYDARRIKAYEFMQELGKVAEKSQEFIDELWKSILAEGDLLKEYMYYLDNHTFLDEIKVNGYGMTDLYMWLLRQNNLKNDYGKNNESCNKETLVFDTFWHMDRMIKDPQTYITKLEDDFGIGMDQMF